MNNIDEFLRGQRDCKDGIEHKSGGSEFYDRGYSYQYFIEQQQSERTQHQLKTGA
jgi:hypothetical protein